MKKILFIFMIFLPVILFGVILSACFVNCHHTKNNKSLKTVNSLNDSSKCNLYNVEHVFEDNLFPFILKDFKSHV